MIRPFRPWIAIVVLAGCQQPGPAVDPFLYRSTIPPPGTSLSAGPTVTPGPQPYYSTAPAAVPGPADSLSTPPPIVQPAPVAPLAPAPVALPPRNFPTRGGFDVPQSSNDPPRATAVAPANAVAAAEPPIRIVEPPVQRTAALPADGLAKPPNTLPTVLPASAITPLPAALSAANGTSVNYPGDHPGLTYGYDPGYTALRGKLDYSVTARLWRLRYLPLDSPIDEYGGNVVIADSRQVSGFEPGDFVAVQGTLSPPAGPNSSATYALTRIKRQ